MERKSGRWRKEICPSGVRRRGRWESVHEHPQACTLSVVQAKQAGHWGVRKKRNGTRKTCGGKEKGREEEGEREKGPSVVSVTAG